jgi:hypothetical protein
VPILLGGGRRLFEHLGEGSRELQLAGVTQAPGVTHLQYHLASHAPGGHLMTAGDPLQHGRHSIRKPTPRHPHAAWRAGRRRRLAAMAASAVGAAAAVALAVLLPLALAS